MIRSVCRLLGLVLLAAGFVFFIYDGTKSLADQTIYISKFSQAWAEVHQQSLLALQGMVEKNADWALNDTKIVYDAAVPGEPADIWMMDADGSGRHRITGTDGNDQAPSL